MVSGGDHKMVSISLPQDSVHPLRTETSQRELGICTLFLYAAGVSEEVISSIRKEKQGDSSDAVFSIDGSTIGIEATEFVYNRKKGKVGKKKSWETFIEEFRSVATPAIEAAGEQLHILFGLCQNNQSDPQELPPKVDSQKVITELAGHLNQRKHSCVTKFESEGVTATVVPAKLVDKYNLNSERLLGVSFPNTAFLTDEEMQRKAMDEAWKAKAKKSERSEILLIHEVREQPVEPWYLFPDEIAPKRCSELAKNTEYKGIYLLSVLETTIEFGPNCGRFGTIQRTREGQHFRVNLVPIIDHPKLLNNSHLGRE